MSAKIASFNINPDYIKDNGLFVLDIDRDGLPLGFEPKARTIVTIPPQAQGGNHRHSRIEAFVGFGEGLELHWIDESGEHQSAPMNPNGELLLFVMPSMVPHAVVNTSTTTQAFLLEYADQTPSENTVEPFQVIESN